MYEVAIELAGRWHSEAECFDEVMRLEGEVFREFANRRTLRTVLGERACFVKQHLGVGWGEIVRNLVTFRLPVLGAGNEWHALNLLTRIGVRVPRPMVFATRGLNAARQHSFVVMEALDGLVSLEVVTLAWLQNPPVRGTRRMLAKGLALMTRTLHEHGVNHRDYYLCHVLVDPAWLNPADGACRTLPNLHLIDLHRAQIRSAVPERWRVKDVGGLLFSTFHAEPSRCELARFVTGYTRKSLRQSLVEDRVFWGKVLRRASQLWLQDQEEVPAWVGRIARSLA